MHCRAHRIALNRIHQHTAPPVALPSLRAAGEAIYPSTDALLDCFTAFAMTKRQEEVKRKRMRIQFANVCTR